MNSLESVPDITIWALQFTNNPNNSNHPDCDVVSENISHKMLSWSVEVITMGHQGKNIIVANDVCIPERLQISYDAYFWSYSFH